MIEEPKIFKNLNIYDKLSSIILDNKIKFNRGSNLVFFKNDSYRYAKDFLYNESAIYGAIFSKLQKDGLIKFNKKWDSCFNIKKQRLEIKYTKTLDDIFSIVHEFFHFIYYSEKDSSIYNLFKEVFSILNELKLGEYLKKIGNAKEVEKQINNIYYENYKMCINSKLELELYKKLKQDGKINNELYNYYFNQRIFYDKISIDILGVYIFGILLSAYINQSLKNGEISKLNYEFFKYEFIKLSFKDICDMLNLELSFNSNGLDISDDSIKRLEKSYKLEVGKYIEK